MISTNSQMEISYSDNSHIFGVPFTITESWDTSGILIKRKDLDSWIEKTMFLQDAGIEVHFNYSPGQG